MHVPPVFSNDDADALEALVAASPLATLVCDSGKPPAIDHVPLLYVDGHLWGHIARANPLSGALARGRVTATAIFHGPEAYVSPGWYPSKQRHGKVVPTWNYVVAHIHGELCERADPAWIREQITRLTLQQEDRIGGTWRIEDAPAGFIDNLTAHIVGLELTPVSFEMKWKLSQNRPEEDRLGVLDALGKAHPMTTYMRSNRPP